MEKGESGEVFSVPQQSVNIVMVLELRSAVFVMAKAIISVQFMGEMRIVTMGKLNI